METTATTNVNESTIGQVEEENPEWLLPVIGGGIGLFCICLLLLIFFLGRRLGQKETEAKIATKNGKKKSKTIKNRSIKPFFRCRNAKYQWSWIIFRSWLCHWSKHWIFWITNCAYWMWVIVFENKSTTLIFFICRFSHCFTCAQCQWKLSEFACWNKLHTNECSFDCRALKSLHRNKIELNWSNF